MANKIVEAGRAGRKHGDEVYGVLLGVADAVETGGASCLEAANPALLLNKKSAVMEGSVEREEAKVGGRTSAEVGSNCGSVGRISNVAQVLGDACSQLVARLANVEDRTGGTENVVKAVGGGASEIEGNAEEER